MQNPQIQLLELEKRLRELTAEWNHINLILNDIEPKKEFKGVIKMPKIVLAYTNPNLKAGDKVQVLTNADHYATQTASQTASWGTSSESKYCYRTYTVTEEIARKLKNRENIYMKTFPELKKDASDWVMHYADFKMATITEIIETPVYQILKVTEEGINNILLTPDKEQAETLLKNLLEKETNPKVKYTKIEFTLKKKVEKEYE